MFFRGARGQDVLVPMLVLSGWYRGQGAGDITQGHSQWLTDTNYGFNLLLLLSLTPLHLAADISTRDILTVSLKSLSCLHFFLVPSSTCLCASLSLCLSVLHLHIIYAAIKYSAFIFWVNPCHPFLPLGSHSLFLSTVLATTFSIPAKAVSRCIMFSVFCSLCLPNLLNLILSKTFSEFQMFSQSRINWLDYGCQRSLWPHQKPFISKRVNGPLHYSTP